MSSEDHFNAFLVRLSFLVSWHLLGLASSIDHPISGKISKCVAMQIINTTMIAELRNVLYEERKGSLNFLFYFIASVVVSLARFVRSMA